MSAMEEHSMKGHLEQKHEDEEEVGSLPIERPGRVSDLITSRCVLPAAPVALDLTSLPSDFLP